MIELLGYVLAGVGLGTFTGMIPGIHVNNLAPLLVSFALASSLPPASAVAIIVAMMIVHTFISYIPSTFLGAPEEGTALSVLPAHRLLLQGRGFEAISLTAVGCLGSLLLTAALIGPLVVVVGPTYEFIQPCMHWILIAIIGAMIFLERSKVGAIWAILVFFLSGFLGLLVLDTSLCQGDAGLMPLLSGLFGASVLLFGFINKSKVPEQGIEGTEIGSCGVRPLCAGTMAGVMTGILPGIGPAQGTILAQLITRSKGVEDFLTSVSGVNISKALFSFVTLYAIGRPRSGAAVAAGQLMEVGVGELVFMIGVALFAGGLAAIMTIRLGKLAARHISKLPYRLMCAAVICLISGFSFYFCGWMGLLVLATATAIGVLPAVVQVKRTHAMGCIMLPCILYFAGLKGGVLSALGL
jgi:putative membrane protein